VKKKVNKNKLVAYGYVGRWSDGTLGWFLPRHLSQYDTLSKPSSPDKTFDSMVGELAELCKITIEIEPSIKRRQRVK